MEKLVIPKLYAGEPHYMLGYIKGHLSIAMFGFGLDREKREAIIEYIESITIEEDDRESG